MITIIKFSPNSKGKEIIPTSIYQIVKTGGEQGIWTIFGKHGKKLVVCGITRR